MEDYKCKHYNGRVAGFGAGEECGECDAFVNVRLLVDGPDTGWFKRMPCDIRNKTEITCVHLSLPTAEEVEASKEDRKRWMDAFMAKLKLVDPLICSLKESHPHGGEGVEECPSCKGSLHWGIAECNGHIHMRCETQDCINFME